MRNFLIAIALMGFVGVANAQRPGRVNPAKRVQMEKDSVLAKITNLSDDQKLIIESLYSDYESSLSKLTAGGRDDPQAFRQNIQKAAEEKNQMMKEVLDDEQWTIFNQMLEDERERRKQRRNDRGGRNRNRPDDGGKDH